MRNRTWPVFLVGLGSLLALLFVPGLTALYKTQEVYEQIRRIQEAHQRNQESLNEIESRMYLVSILVRELLLDDSPVNSRRYETDFQESRAEIDRQIANLKKSAPSADITALARLETELLTYWTSVEPIFQWSPAERTERATFFLREQQRPRRQSILAIADEIGALTEGAYRKQIDEVNQSQRDFRTDIERIVMAAFLIGAGIAGGSILRISTLEQKAERHRINTEKAEEQLRSLSTQLMHAQEEERRTLSRELHDEVGQMLTGLRMELGSLERLRDDPAQFHEHLAEAKTITEQTLRSVRDLAVGLRPSVLDLGLLPALQWQARHFSKRSGIRVSVHAQGSLEEIPDTHSTCVYRIVQETLTNCARHAEAAQVEVALRQSGSGLEVTIRDDGRGFDLTRAKQRGLGLIGIEERVRELGGALDISSTPGSGTMLSVRLELPARSAA